MSKYMSVMVDGLERTVRKAHEEEVKWNNDHPNDNCRVPNPYIYNEFYAVDVYTTVEDFDCRFTLVRVHDYEELSADYAKWIKDTQKKLLANKTTAEKKFSTIISQSNTKVIEQPYFKIGEKGYFLDFYLPEYDIAFELNGKVHKGFENEDYDIDRDMAFYSIGIRTIRVSNLDIDTPNIREKINEWVNAVMRGVFDPSRYYRRSDTRKFDGKETTFEKIHKKINAVLEKKKYVGKSVIIVTTQTYLCSVLSEKRYDTTTAVNKECLDAFFDIIEKNSIRVSVFFNGNMENMGEYRVAEYARSNIEATKRKIDYILRVVGTDVVEERYKYKDVHPVQVILKKDEAGNEICKTECPYNMFFPYIEHKGKKHKKRRAIIRVCSHNCRLCKFYAGEDKEKNFVFCKGFEHHESRNIYDNYMKPTGEFKERIKERLAYKETKEYKELIKHFEEQDNARGKAKYTQINPPVHK